MVSARHHCEEGRLGEAGVRMWYLEKQIFIRQNMGEKGC